MRAQRAEKASQHHRRFELFREMHKTRDFQLELWANVWHRVGEYSVEMLKQAVAAEMAKGGFDDTFPEPLWFTVHGRPLAAFEESIMCVQSLPNSRNHSMM